MGGTVLLSLVISLIIRVQGEQLLLTSFCELACYFREVESLESQEFLVLSLLQLVRPLAEKGRGKVAACQQVILTCKSLTGETSHINRSVNFSEGKNIAFIRSVKTLATHRAC